MTTLSLFPTAIKIVDLSSHPDLSKLENIIYQLKDNAVPHGLVNNALSSYVSNGVDILDYFPVKGLKNTLETHIDSFRKELGMAPLLIKQSWFNIMEANHYVKPHRHELSQMSGVFYVRADDDSCNLKFHSPLNPMKMNELIVQDTRFNEQAYTINSKTGYLVLFPSWLEHSTDSNPAGIRIAVSFNTINGPEHKVQFEYNVWKNNTQ